jgi:hypothetical protein
MRCKIHQELFDLAGLDRINDRGSEFGNELSSLICDSTVCPIHKTSLNRNDECFERGCDFKMDTPKKLVNTVLFNLNDRILKFKVKKEIKNERRNITC